MQLQVLTAVYHGVNIIIAQIPHENGLQEVQLHM